MLRRSSPPLALLGILVVAGFAASGVADGKTGKKVHKHALKGTVELGTIKTTGQFPAVGSTIQDAGIVSAGRPFGSGAETDSLKVKSLTTTPSTVVAVAGTAILYFKSGGSLNSKVTFNAMPQADGSTTYSGSGTFTGGTGPYKGATGRATFTGSAPSNTGITTLNVKGSVSY
ncbi:MAG TPA: hypothetical protein VGI67_03310 [Thermoleophilaceae bacterium]|jgi:hypothetical protein